MSFLNELYIRLDTGERSSVGIFSKKIENLHSLRRQLALLPVDFTPEIGTMILHELDQVSADRYLLLATRLSFDSVTAIVKLKEQARYVSLFYFVEEPPAYDMEKAFERMRLAGVDVYVYVYASSRILQERKK